jgi:hypothetical protein
MAYLGKTPSQAVRSRYYYTATGGETSLSGADDNSNVLTFTDGNYVDVSLNGVALVAGTDYNTTTTNTIGGLTALVASDVVEVIVYDTFSVFGGNMAANLNFKDNIKANFGTGNDLQIFHDGSDSIIRDAGTGSLKFQYGTSDGVVFDSSGNVGIGISNPSDYYTNFNDLVLGSTSTHSGMTIASGTSHDGTIAFADGTSGDAEYKGFIQYNHTNNAFGIGTNGVEAMRIDSSGNLLVGKTAVDSNVAGFEAESGGKIAATRDGSRTAIFNRLTSDGEIVAFRKDGSTVGSIGTASGGVSLGSGDTGLYFEPVSNEIRPFNTTTNASIDDAINLGNSTKRFKNLYLSGGVYLGGTGSANQLSDYETGTWTPRLRGGTTEPGTLTTGTGTYTKIGRLVTVTWDFYNVSTTGYSGTLSVDQITFSPSLSYMSGGNVMFNLMATFPTTTSNIVCHLTGSSDSILFYGSESQAGWTSLTHNAGPSARYMIGSLTYEAT